MTDRALARTAAQAITEQAWKGFDQKKIDLIRHTIMPEGSNDAELAMFLEIAARYELDPFTSQIWAVRYQGKVRNIVGRDGWIALANRYADYRGVQSFEVREHDEWDTWVEDGHVIVQHRWRDAEGKPTHGGRDGSLRGPIIGGFAYARREGFIDSQFMAYADQYDQSGAPKHNAWKSHPSAMTVKVAEAMALRKLYPLSGLFAEGELTPDRPTTTLTAPGAPVEIDFGDDEELAQKLQDAFQHLGYKRAKVRTIMRGCRSREEREAVLQGLQVEADGGVVDAEVIDSVS